MNGKKYAKPGMRVSEFQNPAGTMQDSQRAHGSKDFSSSPHTLTIIIMRLTYLSSITPQMETNLMVSCLARPQ